MTHEYQALSEKEKQTLRLLVNGYDAKSMARHLGLSVHTVNERLRDARRKMAVSSSREAARKLREAERHDPELLGDEHFGDEPPAAAVRQYPLPAEGSGNDRRQFWVVGGIVMSFSLALLALASLSGGAETPAPASQSAASEELAAGTVAASSARQWLAAVDRSDWNESWNATGESFKALNTTGRWTEASEAARRPLGAVLSRNLVSEEWFPAPPYGYRVVRFKTSFANKSGAIETLSLSLEDGSWKVVAYIID